MDIKSTAEKLNREWKGRFAEIRRGIISRLSPQGRIEREKWLLRQQRKEARRALRGRQPTYSVYAIKGSQARIASHLRTRLYLATRGGYRMKRRQHRKPGLIVRNLGCTTEEFIRYISSLFKPGMSWSDRGEWHLDHIRPIASFDLTDPKQVAEACHYTNIRPLWAKENFSRPKPRRAKADILGKCPRTYK
ncbi:hypothetical protein LCGC14_2910790 [marine sediment metagenome]|uniref:Uncharacterized protein n=1 Tax=marine sediment metagenome TaxID=412755 RepID=A0A0F8ZZD0_9ZZZZ